MVQTQQEVSNERDREHPLVGILAVIGMVLILIYGTAIA